MRDEQNLPHDRAPAAEAGSQPSPQSGAQAGDRVSDRVATQILDRIARGELTPGERLPGERQLAEQMGVSRVSVRAALQRLKTQGFLAAVQGGGTRVVSTAGDMDPALMAMMRVEATNFYDLAEIRLVLEGWAAGRAARNATPEQVEEIRRTVERMAEAGRGRLRTLDDAAFHLAIGKASGSAIYLHILSVIRDALTHLLEYQRHELFGSSEDDVIIAQHRRVCEAIATGDAEGATAAMRAHLAWVLDHYHRTAAGAAAGLPLDPTPAVQRR
ncbi:FadR/GntR family transcriptional regulator [Arenibaculum pallidiluteum]|uniref:FadR/GntR family transcriptional regulator n=1 Tax=Arenibaculum pallidiluteum TaxID=2812559 RepID=UPI002E290FB0|nr:FadR/GntR family transcriptional regulator [Arenibaculum pallidiluteum]